MADKRPAPFSLRLTFEQRAQLEQDAGGMSLAAYIQSRLFDSENPAPRRRGKRPVQDYQALAQVLGNLGQSRLRSEEHTSELKSLMRSSYAVFILKKKQKEHTDHIH